VPHFDLTIGNYTLVPNPFWGGALFPLVVLLVLGSWPWIERRLTGDRGFHNVLDRPRDAPGRTAFGVGFLLWVFLIFFVGSAGRQRLEQGSPRFSELDLGLCLTTAGQLRNERHDLLRPHLRPPGAGYELAG